MRSAKSQDKKAIVDRWFREFWGKSWNPRCRHRRSCRRTSARRKPARSGCLCNWGIDVEDTAADMGFGLRTSSHRHGLRHDPCRLSDEAIRIGHGQRGMVDDELELDLDDQRLAGRPSTKPGAVNTVSTTNSIMFFMGRSPQVLAQANTVAVVAAGNFAGRFAARPS